MKENSRNINRRSFVGKTGKMAAGFTLLPSSFLIDHSAALSAAPTAPGGSADTAGKRSDTLISALRWWQKEPLRIVELEEGFGFRILESSGALPNKSLPCKRWVSFRNQTIAGLGGSRVMLLLRSMTAT